MQELVAALYEGAKVKPSEKKNKKIFYVAAGICAAFAIAVAVIAFGGNKKEIQVTEADTTQKAEVEQEIVEEQVISGTETMDMQSKEEELGEQIAFYNPQNSTSIWFHTLFCKPDGTVEARGWNESGQCDVQDWEHIVSVKAGARHSLGLRSDGVVKATGDNLEGQCDVEHWNNVVQICAGEWISFGVTADGKVLIAGTIDNDAVHLENLGDWTEIKSIAYVGYDIIAGLKYDGTVVFEGLFPEKNITGWENVEYLYFQNRGCLKGLCADGTVLTAYLNEKISGGSTVSDIKIRQEQERGILELGVSADGKIIGTHEEALDAWNELISVCSVTDGLYYGLKEDGTLLEYVSNIGNASLEEFRNLEWAQIVPPRYNDGVVGIIGRTKEGKNLYYGNEPYLMEVISMLDENQKIKQVYGNMCLLEDGTLYSPDAELPKSGVYQIVPHYVGCYCLMQDGTVVSYTMHSVDSNSSEKLEGWESIQSICGDYWVCGLKADGTVVFNEERESEASGIQEICASSAGVDCLGLKNDGTVTVLESSISQKKGQQQIESWEDIVQISMGQCHTVGLRSDGTVVAIGSNHCGQCDVEEWKDIVYINAYNQCTIGITKDGDLLMAGSLY